MVPLAHCSGSVRAFDSISQSQTFLCLKLAANTCPSVGITKITLAAPVTLAEPGETPSAVPPEEEEEMAKLQPPQRSPARIGIKYAHVFWKPPFAVFQWKDRNRNHITMGYKMK